MTKGEIMETREALSAIYWSDLLDLLEQGEISRSRARTLMNDMFESGPDDRPLLREPYWRIYVHEMTTDLAKSRPRPLWPWFDALRNWRL